MNYWLMKSEPDVFSIQDLARKKSEPWDGVRNYQARNNLRAMKSGELVLFYHSNIGLEVVGIAQVIKEHYPDPTAEKGDWSAVDLAPLRPLERAVQLSTMKSDPALSEVGLVRNPRLSVMPLSSDEFFRILDLAGTTL